MKRDQLILLLQPYKNSLMPKTELSSSINRFADKLLNLCERFPRLRFNAALPGYILECIDPLTISSLRDMLKRGQIEWQCMGYTEPFLSFSPQWLTNENIALGMKVFTELTGEAPHGYVPPFSNWEPPHIDSFSGAGLKYAVISNALLAKNEAGSNDGYWITEYTGSSIAVFPVWSYHKHNAPQNLAGWIKEKYTEGKSEPRMLVLRYLYSLEQQDNGKEQQEWIEKIAAETDKHILELHSLRFKDVLGNTPPLGLHYFPSSLVPSHNEPASPYFLNHLHCYDQIGILQRKLMEACDNVRGLKETKLAGKLKRRLFFSQDINRFLPSQRAGFSSITDRLWTYGKLIDIESELYELKNTQNGCLRLTDFLRNGYKSIIMSNRHLKIYLDHKNGSQIYELDYSGRSFNACAAYNPRVRSKPNVIIPRESRLAFCDKIFTEPLTCDNYISGSVKDSSNFSDSPFEYTFKNTPAGVKVLMNCHGGFIKDGRSCPLSMEKVFGLEKDNASLSYSYKLSNSSLTNYSFTFGIELPLALAGALLKKCALICNKKEYTINGETPVIIENAAAWDIEDWAVGVKTQFVTQKNVNVWAFSPEAGQIKDSNGIILMISCPVDLDPNGTFLFTGKIDFRKLRTKGLNNDSL
ncbi:MAG: DUF1926 domain-containing protein [Chitinispirillales bacterium]|jgi:hypothetical protein|nr:DUF1926 domain-containing protein [Chitinispirillales bacterium]